MHSPSTHMDSKSSNSHRYNKFPLENSSLTSCQGVNTEGQRIHQSTSFQDDQYDENLVYPNEDTNRDQTLLNNAGATAEKGLFCVTCRGMISVCQCEPDNGIWSVVKFVNQNNFKTDFQSMFYFLKTDHIKNKEAIFKTVYYCFTFFFPAASDAYLGSCQISAMELFCQKLLSIFVRVVHCGC